MPNVKKNTGGTWGDHPTWREVWKNTSGVWNKLYTKALLLYTNGTQNVPWSGYGVTWGGGNAIVSVSGGTDGEGSDYSNSARIYAVSTLDLTNFTKLCIDYQGSITGGYSLCYGMLAVNTTNNVNTATVYKKYTGITSWVRKVDIIDISALSGLYYIIYEAQSYADYSNTTVTIYRIWLE